MVTGMPATSAGSIKALEVNAVLASGCSISMESGVSVSGCDDWQAVALLLPFDFEEGASVALPEADEVVLPPLMLALELFLLAALRMTWGLMIGSGSRGWNSGEQWIIDMLALFLYSDQREYKLPFLLSFEEASISAAIVY